MLEQTYKKIKRLKIQGAENVSTAAIKALEHVIKTKDNYIIAGERARIKLASTEIAKINQVSESIKGIVEKTGVDMRGPIPLPTKKLKVTTRKSPDGEGKASWERYQMNIHKRLIDVQADERTLRLIMRILIPEGLNIEIEMVNV